MCYTQCQLTQNILEVQDTIMLTICHRLSKFTLLSIVDIFNLARILLSNSSLQLSLSITAEGVKGTSGSDNEATQSAGLRDVGHRATRHLRYHSHLRSPRPESRAYQVS